MTSFQLVGLPEARFAPLFDLDDASLARLGARRVFAAESPGYPCRVSLADAAIGEELLLLPYEHQPAASPYRASGPIFVRRHGRQAALPVDFVPPYVSTRLMSLRAYDAADCIVDADVCDGAGVASRLREMFASPAVAYIHLHNARRGCFSCLAKRA